MLTHIDDESIENFIRSTWNVESAKHPFQVHIRPELKNIIGDIKTNDYERCGEDQCWKAFGHLRLK